MSEHVPHFLKHFNPCADRVESIDKSLLGELDEHSTIELMDHVETCKRCRRYHGYMESVEKGFRGHTVDLHEVSPFATNGLPSSMQEEIAQSMKRNLSKWMLELVRSYMHQKNLTIKFFLELSKLHSPLQAFCNSNNIIKSLLSSNLLLKSDITLLNKTNSNISSFYKNNNRTLDDSYCNILDSCITLDSTNFTPYFYYDQILLRFGKIKLANSINDKALSKNPNNIVTSHLLNHKGVIYHALGQYNDALQSFKQSLSKYNHPNPHMNISIIHTQQNSLNKSLLHISQAIDLIDSIPDFDSRIHTKRYFSNYLSYHYESNKKSITTNTKLYTLVRDYFGL